MRLRGRIYVLLTCTVFLCTGSAIVSGGTREQSMWEDFNLRLRGTIESRYNLRPRAIIDLTYDTLRSTISELVFREFPCSLLISSCSQVDESNVEAVAMAFFDQNSTSFGINPAALKAARISSNTSQIGVVTTQIIFFQCLDNIPVRFSEIVLTFYDNSLRNLHATALRLMNVSTSPRLSSTEALAILDSTEQKRFAQGISLYPVSGYGMVANKISDDICDFRDSLGNLIPLSSRVSGMELLFAGRDRGGVMSPALVWEIAISASIEGREVPYFYYSMDANTGEIIGRRPTTGGCVVQPWMPDHSCSRPTTKSTD